MTRRRPNSLRTRRECFEAHRWFDAAGHVRLSCHICGEEIDPVRTPWEAEHVIRRVLKPSDAPEDVLPAHVACHAPKTAQDNSENAKGKRISDHYYGIKQSRSIMPGSKRSPWRKKMDGTVERR